MAAIDEVLIRSAGLPAAAGLRQVREERGDHVHQPADVEVDLALPVVDLQLLDAGDELDTGVVEHQVGLAEAFGHPVGGGLDCGAVGDVDGQGERGAAGGLDVLDQAVETLLATGQYDDGGAEFGEPFGGDGTHAAGGAGDDGDTAGQGVPVSRADADIAEPQSLGWGRDVTVSQVSGVRGREWGCVGPGVWGGGRRGRPDPSGARSRVRRRRRARWPRTSRATEPGRPAPAGT